MGTSLGCRMCLFRMAHFLNMNSSFCLAHVIQSGIMNILFARREDVASNDIVKCMNEYNKWLYLERGGNENQYAFQVEFELDDNQAPGSEPQIVTAIQLWVPVYYKTYKSYIHPRTKAKVREPLDWRFNAKTLAIENKPGVAPPPKSDRTSLTNIAILPWDGAGPAGPVCRLPARPEVIQAMHIN